MRLALAVGSAVIVVTACAKSEQSPIDEISVCSAGCSGAGSGGAVAGAGGSGSAGSGGRAPIAGSAGSTMLGGSAGMEVGDSGVPASGAGAGGAVDAGLEAGIEPEAAAPEPECGDNPISAVADWVASSSTFCESVNLGADCPAPISEALDGDGETRFTTGKAQSGDEWVEIDLGEVATFTQVVLNNTSAGDYPRHWQLRASLAPPVSDAPVLIEGEGTVDTVTITLPSPINAQYVRISQTGSAAPMVSWWSIHELAVECN